MQPSVQQSVQRERQRSRGRPFVKGQSGNPLGSRLLIERRAAMLADLDAECGGRLAGTDRVMAERAFELLTRRPRSHDEAVRLCNAGSRIIDRLRAKYAKREPVHVALREQLAAEPEAGANATLSIAKREISAEAEKAYLRIIARAASAASRPKQSSFRSNQEAMKTYLAVVRGNAPPGRRTRRRNA